MNPPTKEQLREEFLKVIADFSYDLSELKMRNGKLPTQAAIAQLESIFTSHLQALREAIEAELPKSYEAPGLHRQELGEREFQKQFNYNLGIVECKAALAKAFGEIGE